MTISIRDGFEKINQIMKCCIEKERVENGLLDDVETFIPIYYNESGVDEPCIWMVQHPTTAKKQADITQTVELVTPFEFDCVVYETDLEESNAAGQNLANRVLLSVVKNWITAQNDISPGKRLIRNIEFETYYPVGEINIQGKSDKVPATGVILNVIHVVNWKVCCKELNQNNQGE